MPSSSVSADTCARRTFAPYWTACFLSVVRNLSPPIPAAKPGMLWLVGIHRAREWPSSQHQAATPKSAQINRCGESPGSGPNDDSVVDLSLFSHDVAPNRQMSESSPI